jgi:hypothetical protein
VGVERRVHLFLDIGGQAIAADEDNRIKMVGEGALRFALRGGKFNEGHAAIIGAMKKQPAAFATANASAPAKISARGGKVNKAWLHDHINDFISQTLCCSPLGSTSKRATNDDSACTNKR